MASWTRHSLDFRLHCVMGL